MTSLHPLALLMGEALMLLLARATYLRVGMFFGSLRGLLWAIFTSMAFVVAIVGIVRYCGGMVR
jgi:hypothetical protein